MDKTKDFYNIEYKRLDFNTTEKYLNRLIDNLKDSEDFNSFLEIFKKIIDIQNEIEEMFDYADIRNMRDSRDEFYEGEIDYWNSSKIRFDNLFIPFYEEILNSKYKNQLRDFVPEAFFLTLEYTKKVTNNNITDLEVREKELYKKYRNLISGKVVYNGEEINISKLIGLSKNNDRNKRKEIIDIYNAYFYQNKKAFDEIFIELIKIRKEIALRLGFTNYSEYSLYKLRRFGYDYKDIHAFRDNIKKYIPPLINKLRKTQEDRLKIEKLEYYDTVFFSDPPKSIYEGEKLLEAIGSSLKEIDTDLYDFYINFYKSGYIDLLNRDNKVGFNITNYLSKSGLPVITGNFKNNYKDITSTLHELGHGFQKYNASIMDKNYIVSPLLKYPTMEIAEMFSYALELIALPYLSNLFEEADYNKYCFEVIYDLINLLPYVCLVDEFQEQIYLMDEITEEKIHETWLTLAKKYNLEYQNTGNKNLEEGCFFFRQSHIFLNPFYYIDYGISQIGAFVIASLCESDLEAFKNIASVASYYSIKELRDKYNLPDPFAEENISKLSKRLEKTLNTYNKGVEDEI